jgi:hypothetical protein
VAESARRASPIFQGLRRDDSTGFIECRVDLTSGSEELHAAGARGHGPAKLGLANCQTRQETR